MKQVWQLTDGEMEWLVSIMREHTKLARMACMLTGSDRESLISQINELEKERIKIIGR